MKCRCCSSRRPWCWWWSSLSEQRHGTRAPPQFGHAAGARVRRAGAVCQPLSFRGLALAPRSDARGADGAAHRAAPVGFRHQFEPAGLPAAGRPDHGGRAAQRLGHASGRRPGAAAGHRAVLRLRVAAAVRARPRAGARRPGHEHRRCSQRHAAGAPGSRHGLGRPLEHAARALVLGRRRGGPGAAGVVAGGAAVPGSGGAGPGPGRRAAARMAGCGAGRRALGRGGVRTGQRRRAERRTAAALV